MHVEVAFHDLVTGHMGKFKTAAHTVAMRAFFCLGYCCKGYEAKNKGEQFMHWNI